MSRAASGVDPIPVAPSNNVYTVLVVVATIINALTLAAMFLKYNAVFGDWPFTISQ